MVIGSLAQLVERLPYTQNVGSSRLSRPTKSQEGWMSGLNQQFAKLRGAVRCPEGSNPSPSTMFFKRGNI